MNKDTIRKNINKSKVRKRDKYYLQRLHSLNPNLKILIENFDLVQIKTSENELR